MPFLSSSSSLGAPFTLLKTLPASATATIQGLLRIASKLVGAKKHLLQQNNLVQHFSYILRTTLKNSNDIFDLSHHKS